MSNIFKDATAVITAVGAFGSNEFMEKVNGDLNIGLVDAAAKMKSVKFMGMVGAATTSLPSFILASGYFNGKKRSSETLLNR